jgi:hypothetical protein
LAIEGDAGEKVFHLAAYGEMFLDIDSADAALADYEALTVSNPHLALTPRAFESTQTARMGNAPLNDKELKPFEDWKQDADRKVSDLSVRLLLGLR